MRGVGGEDQTLEEKPPTQERVGPHESTRGRFPNTPPWSVIPYCLCLKNSEKPSEKNMEKEHIVYVSSCCTNCLIKNLNVRNIWKTHIREKEYNSLNHQVEYSIIWIQIHRRGCEESPPESGISLSLIIPIPRTRTSQKMMQVMI